MYDIIVPEGAPKVDVMVFSYRQAPVTPLLSLFTMATYSRVKGIDVRFGWYGNALIEHARNSALSARRPGADVLFCDDDMLCQPYALEWLRQMDAPIVAPLFTTRMEPVGITAKHWDEKTQKFRACEMIHDIALNKAVVGYYAVGMAFTLVKAETIDRVLEHHLSGEDWLEENRLMFDRLHVRKEYRETERNRLEEIRRKRHAEGKAVAVFDRWRTDDDMKLGEDITFGRKLISLGIKTVIDTREANFVGHVGEYPYGPWDIGTTNQPSEHFSNLKGGYQITG